MGKIVKNNNESKAVAAQVCEILLFTDQTIGRDPRCTNVLRGDAVSRFHARIRWNGNQWTVKDLGSRNGTYINGRRKATGESHRMQVGDRLLFGDRNEEYLFADESEPSSCLVTYDKQGNETQILLSHLLPLPSEERPLCTIFSGNDNIFYFENETGDILPLEHGQQIIVDATVYQTVLANGPNDSPQTLKEELLLRDAQEEVHLDIAVAPDEESAEVIVHIGDSKHILQPKVHFYLLAHLARIRASQTPSPVAPSLESREDSNGWVDCEVICDDLLINREHLAQQVFRVRQDFKKCHPVIAERIIDRRLRGKVRIGFPANSYNIRTML